MMSQKLNRLELEIAQLLLDRLEHLEATPEQVAQIAKFTLKSLPDNLTDEQIDKVIPSLDDHYTELVAIVHTHLKSQENAISAEAELLLKQGKIDEASSLMRHFFTKKL